MTTISAPLVESGGIGRRETLVITLRADLGPGIERMLTRMGFGVHDVEDILSDTWMALLMVETGRLEAVANQTAYTYAVARNLAFRRMRDMSREPRVIDDLPEELHIDPDSVVTRENGSLVRAAWSRLDRTTRELLWLSQIERQSAKTIATQLGLSVTNVTTRISRAKRMLREEYLTAYLALTPSSCEFDGRLLARFLLRTASNHVHSRVSAHVSKCSECRSRSDQAIEEARSSSPIGVVIIAGVVLTLAVEAKKWSWASLAAGLNAVRMSVIVLGLGALIGLATLLPFFDGAESAPVEEESPEPQVAISAPPAALATPTATRTSGPDVNSGGLDVSPAVVRLDMPAAGEEIDWRMQASNGGDQAISVGLRIVGAQISGDEQPTFSASVGSVTITDHASLNDLVGQLWYVGEIRAGSELELTGFVARNREDVDETLSGQFRIELVADLDVPEGTRPGDPVSDVTNASLPDSGAPEVLGSAILATVMLGMGAVLVSRRRRTE